MSRRHELKCWSEYFAAVRCGAKTFELRWNDRNYAVGDLLVLQEFDPVKACFTGEEETREVSYVSGSAEAKFFGLEAGFVVLGLKSPRQPPREAPPADWNELIAWHSEIAANARIRADGWRRGAARHPISGARYSGAGDAAEAEAIQHEAAVALIKELVSAVRRLAAREPARG